MAAPLFAATPDAKRQELKSVRGRIESLQKDIARTETTRTDAAEELRETEQVISAASRKLRDLGSDRTAAQSALGELNAQSQKLSQRIAVQQAQLGRLFTRQYHAGETDALRHLLSGNDPNQLARDAHYLSLLSHAKAGLIRDLGEVLAEKKRLTGLAQEKSTQLADIEKRQQQEHKSLLDQQKKRQAMLARLSEQLKAQQHEVGRLKRDEQRLTKLIENLGRTAVRPKPAAKPGEPALRNERTPESVADQGSFARLRGRLALPVRGEIAGRFGVARAEGGGTWKGVFIRAASGSEVKAVAAGKIVFADWLRGFGNLTIIDHGEGYLSVYGYNESLFKSVGEAVKAGEAIASVGSSGGNQETGLYFELRHLGQPIDPLKWVSLK